MTRPEELLVDSPADFDTAFAYALHGDVRRLLIVIIVGSILLPVGLSLFLDPGLGVELEHRAGGLVLTFVGAVFFYGGIVALLFKIIADAVIVGRDA